MAKKAKKNDRTGVPLNAKSVEKTLKEMPLNLRRRLQSMRNKYRDAVYFGKADLKKPNALIELDKIRRRGNVIRRYGSPLWSRTIVKLAEKARAEKKPELAKWLDTMALNANDRVVMVLAQAHKASYRAVEEIAGFMPNSGNDAQRTIRIGLKEMEKKGRSISKYRQICKKTGATIHPCIAAAIRV